MMPYYSHMLFVHISNSETGLLKELEFYEKQINISEFPDLLQIKYILDVCGTENLICTLRRRWW